ncbi:MAG: hypothetical protein ABIO96_03990, partial [Nitrospiraceae bacterium]
ALKEAAVVGDGTTHRKATGRANQEGHRSLAGRHSVEGMRTRAQGLLKLVVEAKLNNLVAGEGS